MTAQVVPCKSSDYLPARVSEVDIAANPIDVQIHNHFDAKRNDGIVSSAVEVRLANACVGLSLFRSVDESIVVVGCDAVSLQHPDRISAKPLDRKANDRTSRVVVINKTCSSPVKMRALVNI